MQEMLKIKILMVGALCDITKGCFSRQGGRRCSSCLCVVFESLVLMEVDRMGTILLIVFKRLTPQQLSNIYLFNTEPPEG